MALFQEFILLLPIIESRVRRFNLAQVDFFGEI
jgi:hypothetical protein